MRWWPTTRELNIFCMSRSVRRLKTRSLVFSFNPLTPVTKTDFPLYNSIAIAVGKLTVFTNKSKNARKTLTLTHAFFPLGRMQKTYLLHVHWPSTSELYCKNYQLGHYLLIHYHLSINICISQFILLQCCYHNNIAIVPAFNFLRVGGNWWILKWIFGNLS